MPTNITFDGFIFGDTAHGNGVAGAGYGLEIDNAACVINAISGQALGNATAPVLIGASATANIAQLKGWTSVPGNAWNFDGSDATVVIANGANSALATGSGVVIITDTTSTGDTGIYVLGGGSAALVAQSNGT